MRRIAEEEAIPLLRTKHSAVDSDTEPYNLQSRKSNEKRFKHSIGDYQSQQSAVSEIEFPRQSSQKHAIFRRNSDADADTEASLKLNYNLRKDAILIPAFKSSSNSIPVLKSMNSVDEFNIPHLPLSASIGNSYWSKPSVF